MRFTRALAVPLGLAALAGLAGCFTTRPPVVLTPPVIPAPSPGIVVPPADGDAVPRVEPLARYGNPPFYEVFGKRYHVLSSSADYVERGVASWYGPGFHQVKTSTGEIYDMYRMTAAHKTLPLPAYVRVTNLQNGRTCVVRVNDRGPFVGNRIIDLSYAAASRLDMLRNGTAMVEVRAIDPRMSPVPPPVTSALVPADATPAIAAAPAAGATTATPAAVAPAPSSLPVTPTGSPTGVAPTAVRAPLFVQAGAFADPANAEHLAATLRGGVYGKIFVRDDVIAGRRMYRVRIGPVPNVPEFDRIVTALEHAGVHDAHLALD